MMCQSCQEREATVVITKVSGQNQQVTQLCQACANVVSGAGGVAITIQKMTEGKRAPTVACPSCGKSFAEFRKSGLFGCEVCYKAFETHLEPLFRRVQGATHHEEDQSFEVSFEVAASVEALKKALQEAVKKEAFEEAAALRDQLRQRSPGATES